MIQKLVFRRSKSLNIVNTSKKEWVYNHRLSQFYRLTTSASIIMLGDSLTENGEWRELLPEYQILNRGISGDTVAGVLSRLDEVVRREPRLLIGLIGINDIAQGSKSDEMINKITEIFKILKSESISVLWQSILYTSPPRKISNKVIYETNQLLKNLTKNYGIHYIDLNSALTASNELSNEVSEDGLHLNGEGYIRWSSLLKTWLDNHCPELRRIEI